MYPYLSPPSICPFANPDGVWILPGNLWGPLAWLPDVYLTRLQAYFLLGLLLLSPVMGWWTVAVVWKKKIDNWLFPVLFTCVPILLGCVLPGVWITNIFRVLVALIVLLVCLATIKISKNRGVCLSIAVFIDFPVFLLLLSMCVEIYQYTRGFTFFCPDGDGCPEYHLTNWDKNEVSATFPDGTRYVGVYRDRPGGFKGTLTYPDGKTFVGDFDFSKDHSKSESVTDRSGRVPVKTYHKHEPWNGTLFDRNGNVLATYSKGVPPWECESDWSCRIAKIMHDQKDVPPWECVSAWSCYIAKRMYGLKDDDYASTRLSKSFFVGVYKEGKPWNGTVHEKDGNITATYLEGVRTEE